MRLSFIPAAGALLCALAACQTETTVTRDGLPRVQGRARVVEVNSRLGMAVLDMKGREFDVYWKPEIQVAHSGSVAQPQNMFQSPVGIYNETTEYPTAFPGRVGDTIDFVGIRAGANEIWVQRVAVVGSAE